MNIIDFILSSSGSLAALGALVVVIIVIKDSLDRKFCPACGNPPGTGVGCPMCNT